MIKNKANALEHYSREIAAIATTFKPGDRVEVRYLDPFIGTVVEPVEGVFDYYEVMAPAQWALRNRQRQTQYVFSVNMTLVNL